MQITDLRGKSRSDQFAIAAKYAGVSADVLEKQWARESNRGDPNYMVSPAGARGHFGIMPGTQKAWEGRTGQKLDPNDFTDGLYMAALTMGENMKATKGDVANALRMYNAGNNPKNWDNKETRGYVAAILGQTPESAARLSAGPASTKSLLDMSDEEIIWGKKAERPEPGPKVKTASAANLAEQSFGLNVRQVDDSNTQAWDNTREKEGEANFHEAMRKNATVGDKFAAGFHEGGMFDGAVHLIEKALIPNDDGHAKWLSENLGKVWEDASQNEDVAHTLLSTNSAVEYAHAKEWISQKTENQRVLESQGAVQGTLWTLAGGVADPVSWVAGAGIGKGFAAFKVGSEALMEAGKVGLGVASLAGENGLANVVGTAVLDASGEATTPQDYFLSGASGMILGAVSSPLHLPRGNVDTSLNDLAMGQRRLAKVDKTMLLQRAEQSLPDGATPTEIARKAEALVQQDHEAAHDAAVSSVPQERKLFPSNVSEALTADPAERAKVIQRYNLGSLPEEVDQRLTAETIAQADRVDAANPTNTKGLTRATSFIPQGESTAMTLLKSELSVFRAYAKTVLENTTGAGGRGQTAVMTANVHEGRFRSLFYGFNELKDVFRRAEGMSHSQEFLGNAVTHAFNRRVYYEVLNRQAGKTSVEAAGNAVTKAADKFEAGMEEMRRAQIDAKVPGWARLPETAKGYMPQKLDPRKAASLTPEQMNAVYDILSDQMQKFNTKRVVKDGVEELVAWDKPFADKAARLYIQRGRDKQAGLFEVPVDLRDPEASELLEDVMKGLGLSYDDRQEALGSIGRGGAGHTKGRINLDLTAPIPDGKGGSMPLGDIFVQDIDSLYMGYARRASSEIGLANHGIMGQKGLDLVLNSAIAQAAAKGIPMNVKEVRAFKQTAAELMGRSFGNRNAAMDNLRVWTAAARLGGAAFNQLGEFSNGVVALGVKGTMAQIPQLRRLWKEVGMLAKGQDPKSPVLGSLDTLTGGVGMSEYHATHALEMGTSDVQIYGQNNVGHFERIVRNAALAQSMVTFHRRITAVQVRGASEQIIHKALRYIGEGRHDKALMDMGLTKDLQGKLRANLHKIKQADGSIDLTAGDLTRDDIFHIRSVINRGSSQIIQRTYIGETAPWVHDSMLSIAYQFRGYGLTAMEKQWSRTTMNHGHLVAFGSLLGAMTWALPIHFARVHAATLGMSRSKRDEYLEKHLNAVAIARAVMNYSAGFGLTGDYIDFAAGIGAATPFEPAKDFAASMGQSGRYGGGTLVGNTIAPGVGLVEDIWKGAHGNVRRGLKTLPMSNIPALQPLFNVTAEEN
ncbi:internal virion protein [Caulobacter phage DCM]|uniref:Internal virion protein n=1 Tax=Caulobacter phage DCM TaxID=3020391 RepID=A0AAF0B407_9CAUD|nr:internal virion protein [Caulobacter phage DCM]WCD56125.1 internal virion protein [Caulobacter phage BL199]